MSLKNKSDDLWEKIELDEHLVSNAIHLAYRDLKAAEDNFNDDDYDWSFAISYNAMLQAGRALMFSQKVRPKGEYKHVSVVTFIKNKFEKAFAHDLLYMFDKIRKKRHTVVYEQVNLISEKEAEYALQVASDFVEKVNNILEGKMEK